MKDNTPLNADDRLAPIEWLLDDLLVTIDDATPEELPNLHAKLVAIVSGLQGREQEWHPKYRKKHELEAKIDTATDILYGFSRTYKQKVTDSSGNVYVNKSHGYISRYEVQELIANLEQELEKL